MQMKILLYEQDLSKKSNHPMFVPIQQSFAIQNVNGSKSSDSHFKRFGRNSKTNSDDFSSDVASAYDAYTMKLSQAL